ncbi:hypothetical protein MRX96_007114 [Rhipicephalus microplus]
MVWTVLRDGEAFHPLSAAAFAQIRCRSPRDGPAKRLRVEKGKARPEPRSRQASDGSSLTASGVFLRPRLSREDSMALPSQRGRPLSGVTSGGEGLFSCCRGVINQPVRACHVAPKARVRAHTPTQGRVVKVWKSQSDSPPVARACGT